MIKDTRRVLSPSIAPTIEATDEVHATALWKNVIAACISCVVLVAFVVFCATRPDFDRPIEHDELLTVRYYTWAGTHADGSANELRHREDFENPASPGIKQLLLGVYCSLGRWPEPNNHIVNSLVADVTMAIGGVNVRSLRASALAGAVLLAVGIHILSCQLWRAPWAGTLAVSLVLWHPYVLEYSRTGRGYTWTLCLQVWLLSALLAAISRPFNLLAAAACVGLAVASVANMLTMGMYFVLPLYAVAWWQGFATVPSQLSATAVSRKVICAQWLAVCGACFFFVIDRLPFIVSSATQYGHRFEKLTEMLYLFREHCQILVPSWATAVLTAAGAGGLLLAPRRSAENTILRTALLGIVFFFGQAVLSHRLPYARVLGFILPLFVLGAVGGVVRAVSLMSRRGYQVGFVAAIAVGACLYVIVPDRGSLEDRSYEAFLGSIEAVSLPGTRAVVISDHGLPITTALYYPANWDAAADVFPGEEYSKVVVLVRRDRANNWSLPLSVRGQTKMFDYWPEPPVSVVDNTYQAMTITGKCTEWRSSDPEPRRSRVVLWYPSFASTELSPKSVTDFLNSRDVAYWMENSRYRAKLQVFSRLSVVAFMPTSGDEEKVAFGVLKEGIQRFGGRVAVVSGLKDE